MYLSLCKRRLDHKVFSLLNRNACAAAGSLCRFIKVDKNASVLLDKADSVREVFLQDVDYSHLFLQMSDASERNGISHRLDSMFGIWSQYARSNYEQYCKDPNPIYRDITLHYTEMALRIRPEEGEMLEIKNKCKI